jgi:hypothetical protein
MTESAPYAVSMLLAGFDAPQAELPFPDNR